MEDGDVAEKTASVRKMRDAEMKNNARERKTSTLKRVGSLADVELGRSTMNLQREAFCRQQRRWRDRDAL